MERTLTTKSIRLRELSQWTAAATLVAAGSLALFSATTLEKLSRNGDVEIDLQGFRKLGSVSLALDRIDEQRLITEEARLLDRAAVAGAEALPRVRTAFTRIRLHPKKKPVILAEKGDEAASLPPVFDPVLSGAPVVLSQSDAEEIAQLERVTDATLESQALAQVYRNLRFQFIAAVDGDSNGFPSESIAIAREAGATAYDEIPAFDAADFSLSQREARGVAAIESAPMSLAAAPPSPSDPDSIPISVSSAVARASMTDLTAEPSVLNAGTKPAFDSADEKTPLPVAAVMSPGLDLVPDAAPVATTTQKSDLNSHETQVEQATGPPGPPQSPKTEMESPLQAKSMPTRDFIPEKAEARVATNAADFHEYSKDVAAVYQGVSEESREYSKEVAEESPLSGEVAVLPHATISITNPVRPKGAKNYGNGVHSDDRGITIDWNEASAPTGGKIFVGKPNAVIANHPVEIKKPVVQPSVADRGHVDAKKGLALSQSSALKGFASVATLEPTVETKKCETARLGMEAFNAGAEKESLSICRRELSFEGAREGDQARWWESYENEAEHWPTLSYLKKGEASPMNRTPLLSTASIRILSAVSKTNTHTGTGILFGEVAKGLEIQLLGRSDSPIYLDAGMKLRDPSSDVAGARQFVFLNVEPGQPLLVVRNREKNLSGTIPLVVKSGMATHLKVPEPREVDLDFVAFDASSAKETRLAGLTAEIIGQPGRMGITDRAGNLKIRKVAVFDGFPIHVDLLKSEKSYKNRYRVGPKTISRGAIPLYYFDEKRVGGWLRQLAGGVSPYSGLIAGVSPSEFLSGSKNGSRHLKIGILEKKSALVPERYLLDDRDALVSDSELRAGRSRYVGVQIPEGPVIPTIVDGKGDVRWSELVYAQPGVINVVNPDL